MFPRASFPRHATLFAAMAAVVTAMLPAAAAELGPPPGAELSHEKLARIDDLINSEIEAGKIPGAIVLIQRHGQPVYLRPSANVTSTRGRR